MATKKQLIETILKELNKIQEKEFYNVLISLEITKTNDKRDPIEGGRHSSFYELFITPEIKKQRKSRSK